MNNQKKLKEFILNSSCNTVNCADEDKNNQIKNIKQIPPSNNINHMNNINPIMNLNKIKNKPLINL